MERQMCRALFGSVSTGHGAGRELSLACRCWIRSPWWRASKQRSGELGALEGLGGLGEPEGLGVGKGEGLGREQQLQTASLDC